MDTPLPEPVFNSFWAVLQEEAGSLRAFHRFPLNLKIEVGIVRDQPPLRGAAHANSPATLTNASVSGFCFSSLEQFPEDTVVVVELELDRQVHRVPAVVRRCAARKKLGRTFYECGAQYVKSEATFAFVPLMAKYLRLQASENTR
jgi:hypothetical protein